MNRFKNQRINNCIAILIITLFGTSTTSAQEWFQNAVNVKDTANLAYTAYGDKECGIGKDDLSRIIEGIFIRSRIKPTKHTFQTDDLYLKVSVLCMKPNPNITYIYQIAFGKTFRDKANLPIFTLIDRQFGGIGKGDESHLEDSVKEGVEDAITEFLKANLDL